MGFHHIAIMASGTGSNARAILKRLKDEKDIKVSLLLSNKKNSGIPCISEDYNIPHTIFSKEEFKNEAYFVPLLKEHKVDFIILAGFLWLIPEFFVGAYNNRILNIHPSLLPKYGGKGMYGSRIHEEVFKQREKKSGLTIHIVNEKYDEGQVVFQKEISIEACDSAQEIGATILANEHRYYPEVILEYIRNFKEL